ncbi:sugar ABC transporter permease [Anaerocolumna cellulosilytica]|uniref:Sugar ABC transporter permease n=1 Tax=Anaerocolumna cellulosilytica TaxID=433286 RepID=A0A6S6R388_9FIRM|nr:carbohydrate ABC transporter permease [Anaerocolumna cellulosilytica]MBB5196710.1 putative aldouronate transport system permease protein [Anaerocolumna cellulosilytica]BCJ93972.1 sugar ABC transporter permease [Anaerocolumna cellulosilytica]
MRATNRSHIKIHKKFDLKNFIYSFVIGLVLTAFIIVTLYPILNTLAVSFNDALDALRGGIYLWPRKWSLNNYYTVLHKESMMTGLSISVLRTVVGTILQLFVTALIAFVLSRKKFVFAKPISILYVLTMYVNGGLIPTFLLFKSLGFMNSFWVYVIPGMVSAFNMLVIRTYMNGLPDSLEESAMMDGAGYFKVFTRIIVPLCKPVFATIALFIAVGQWNSWFDTMLYNRMADSLTTLQYELMKLLSSVSQLSGDANTAALTGSSSQVTTKSVRAAATILTSLPIVVLYPFLQRYFVTGLTIGGVKE